MKTRIIHTKFWSDGYINSLNRLEKLAFIYLITNDQIGLSGIYELPDNKALFETGLNQVEWESVKTKFQADGKFGFCNGWVKIINVDKYQQFSGEKNEIAKKREISIVSKDILDTLSIPYRYPIDTPNNKKSIISNKKSIIRKGEVSTGSLCEQVTDDDLKYISDKYQVPLSFVKSKYEDMVLWAGEKRENSKPRNWKLTLTRWVKRDALEIKQKGNNGKRIVYAGDTF